MSNTATNVMNVKSIPIRRKQPFRIGLWLIAGSAIFSIAAVTLAFDAYYGMFGIIGNRFEIVEQGNVRVIKVPPGGNVQAAIAQAESGDTVELQAGAIYFGEIKLPNKALSGYVTIQSSAAANLPAEKRVGPAQKSSMATIAARTPGRPAVSAVNGANNYRFIGIEFTDATAKYNYALVSFGSGETTAANLPRDLEIDRSYIHPSGSVVRRGIALNSASTTIKNSYIEGFGFPGEETQGICGWTGTRNVRILNNYVEGGAENILFGGADPHSADLTPVDIEIRGNHLNKPESWAAEVTTKTLFELKNAKRVQFVGNRLTNNWKGSAFRITVRNQDNGAPFSTIEDVLIKDNVIDRSGDAINILGKDDTHPSQTLRGLKIENNLFTNIGGGANMEGSGYFIQIADGEDISITNNTVFNDGNIASFYGVVPRRFVFRNNIVSHGQYGIHGLADVRSDVAKAMFQENVIMNLRRVGTGDYSFPGGNTIVAALTDVGFAAPAAKDFRLSPDSRFRGKGSNLGQRAE